MGYIGSCNCGAVSAALSGADCGAAVLVPAS